MYVCVHMRVCLKATSAILSRQSVYVNDFVSAYEASLHSNARSNYIAVIIVP